MGKPLMSYKNTISMGKTSRWHIKIRYIWGNQVDVTEKYDIYGQNHWCHTISMGKTSDVIYKHGIYGKNHRCHIKIQYLCEKPLISNKISVGKTIDVISDTISVGKSIDVI